jgi:hypothetical protein
MTDILEAMDRMKLSASAAKAGFHFAPVGTAEAVP